MYQALYRKWRPRSFDDVVSQPHITAALKNQLAAGKTAHAYLFTGSRGTGKTTCARIFAKTINCENPHDGQPCLECKVCKAAENGSLPDIIEIDAASNSRVDDIRELREGVIYTPEFCKYKVYIIDEVHMLSPGAFNALLKTMEEPPPHVKFVLATTEIHKVPETIVSRCQHFDFGRIRSEDIVARLGYISEQEGFTLHDDAAAMIARLSDGGMRDALSLLDRCSAYSDDITLDIVSNAAGIAGRDYLFDLLEKLAASDTAGAIAAVDELHGKSKDLKVLCGELLTMSRNLMLIRSTDGARDLIACLPEEFERLSAIAATVSLDRIFEFIDQLQQCSERFARASDKRIELEICMIKLCTSKPKTAYDQAGDKVDSAELAALKAQVETLTRALASGTQPAAVQLPQPAEKPKKPPKPLKRFDPNNFTPLNEWQEILDIIKQRSPALWAFLKDSLACIENGIFNVVVPSEFFRKKFTESGDKDILKKIVSEYYHKDFGFMVYTSANVDIKEKEAPIKELINRARENGVEVEIIKK